VNGAPDFNWTPEVCAKFRELWDAGLPTKEIGVRIGVSKSAVIGKAHRLNFPPRPSPIKPKGSGARPRHIREAYVPLAPREKPLPVFTPIAKKPIAQPAVRVVAPAPVKIEVARQVYGRVTECCWPIGEPRRAGFRFCCEPSKPGAPYCHTHCAQAYVRKSPISAHVEAA